MVKEKVNRLREIIEDMGKLIVAYSGGVDSTFLLKIAKDIVFDGVIAVTATSPIHPVSEREEAKRIAKELGVSHIIVESDELSITEFVNNTCDRCYYCKYAFFIRLKEMAKELNILWIADGTNFDDISDFRPGMRALNELGIRSPLKEAELTKNEIRILSKELNLATQDKPSFACLATRFPYGEKITQQKLEMVAQAEDYLMGLGINQLRVRHHGKLARIEVDSVADIGMFANPEVRKQVISKLKSIGYTYVTLDLEGYRTGSMNEILE